LSNLTNLFVLAKLSVKFYQ